MNLKQMREEGTSKRLMDALKTDYLEFPDQDVLNIICQGRVTPLPPYHNSIRTFWLPQYEDAFLKQYSLNELTEVKRHGTIHYTGGKPWNTFSVEYDKWWKTYRSLPESIKKLWQPSAKMKLLSNIYMTVPGKLLIDSLRNIYRRLK